MKKVKYVIVVVLLICLLFIMLYIIQNKKNFIKEENQFIDNNNNNNNEVQSSEIEPNNQKEIEDLKKEINSTADSEIYELTEENDGRKILQIRENIQFNVDLAGIIKNGKPEENEISSLIERKTIKSGIWISDQSRSTFLQLLKNSNLEGYYITKDGYLHLNNTNSEKTIEKEINEMINSNKLYIINMTGISYERDYISGKIIEYPFEEMDPCQIIEPYILDDCIILEVTTNKNKIFKDIEILESITQYK